MLVEYRNANPRLKNNDYDYFLFETDAKKTWMDCKETDIKKGCLLKGTGHFFEALSVS